MSAILEGRPDASFLYFPYFLQDTNSDRYIDLFPSIQSYTYTTSLFGPQVLLIQMTNKNFDIHLNNNSNGILRAIVGDKTDSLVLQISNIVKSWNSDSGEPTVQIEFKSIPGASGFEFSKSVTGGLSNIFNTLLDLTYSEKAITPVAPTVYDNIDPSIFGERLINHQTLHDYVAESRNYAIDIDNYPIYIWEDRNAWYLQSLYTMLEQEPTKIIITTLEKVSRAISSVTKSGPGYLAYAVDFREEVSSDVKKIREQFNTRYIVPRTGGESFDYIRPDGSNESIQKVKVLYQPYDIKSGTKNGVAAALTEMWKTAMSTSRASFVMYNQDCWLRPGMLVTVILGDMAKDYMVVMNFTEGSSQNGMQTISLIGLDEVYSLRDAIQDISGSTPVNPA